MDELENLIRKVVREEVNQALCPDAPLQRSETRSYHLRLISKIPKSVFTGNKIESEDAQNLKVVLQDAATGNLISDCPLSSMKLEIVLLEGDFKAEERLIWTHQDFDDKILVAREGKRPLLIGERFLNLKNGVAFFNDVSISDNSSWVRSKKFRLGVKVAQGPACDVGVQEAVSGAFQVRDKRGEPYKKHPTPSLEDEVWRLDKIAKDGTHSKNLGANGIHTVKDFLQRYHIDHSSLRSILKVSNSAWNTIVEHAKLSTLNNDHYSYFNSGEGVGILFNCVLNVVGVTYDEQNYWALERLTMTQKCQVQKLRLYAYADQSQLVATSANMIGWPCEADVPSNRSSLTNLHQLDIQDEAEKDMNISSPFPFLAEVEQGNDQIVKEYRLHN